MDVSRFFTAEELFAAKGAMLFDVECYPNYFLVSFEHVETGKICFFEQHENTELQIDWIKWILHNFCIVGFGSKKYDLPILSLAIEQPTTTALLKAASNQLIQENIYPENFAKLHNFYLFPANHIDLIEVAPLQGSLKLYGARLHCGLIQELPYHHEQLLTREEKNFVREYNFNDLELTKLLLKELEPSLNLRANLGNEFNQDLRSLSDAQLAQKIITAELTRVLGKAPKKPKREDFIGKKFKYKPPSYIEFSNPVLDLTLREIKEAEIEVGPTGHVICPKSIEGRSVTIGNRTYTIGMGGLHSVEKMQAVIATNYTRVIDRDVTGYYPNLILKNKFAPGSLGDAFLQALQNIVDRRYSAKKSGDKTTADSLKIASNGTFGKLSDPYSPIYDPIMMVQTTLTGQLSLLMAIEWLTQNGIEVVSANTDGIVSAVPADLYDLFCDIFKRWEKRTALETEETEYKALYSRDVNNYFAIKLDNSCKMKGIYSPIGSALNSPLSKNPTSQICADSVENFLTSGIAVEETIRSCQDIRKFVEVGRVTGGAHKDGKYLGKVVRWYYGKNILGGINYVGSGNLVQNTIGAKPAMLLPAHIPEDLNFEHYITVANEMLEDIGAKPKRHQQFKML